MQLPSPCHSKSEVLLAGTSVEITRHMVLEGLTAPWLKLRELCWSEDLLGTDLSSQAPKRSSWQSHSIEDCLVGRQRKSGLLYSLSKRKPLHLLMLCLPIWEDGDIKVLHSVLCSFNNHPKISKWFFFSACTLQQTWSLTVFVEKALTCLTGTDRSMSSCSLCILAVSAMSLL